MIKLHIPKSEMFYSA